MSASQALFLPVFLHFLMTMALGVMTSLARRNALKEGKVKMRDIVLDNRNWPDEARKLGNNFDNQFQMPMLWYAGVAFTLILGLADAVLVALAWAFLLVRVGHSVIHTGSNLLVRRFFVFLAGAVILTLYWLWLALGFYIFG